MPTIKLRPKAESDLANIYGYSVQEWGVARAEAYVMDISTAFQQLTESQSLGRDYSHVRPGLRALNVASHIVFYKPIHDGIAVIRVLHQAMDVQQHL